MGDRRLTNRLQDWLKRIEKLRPIEKQYFELEASEKSFHGELYLLTGSGTVAEREAMVAGSQDWKDFKKGLAEAKSQYNHEKRMLELMIKAYESEYLTYKLENDYIRKGTEG